MRKAIFVVSAAFLGLAAAAPSAGAAEGHTGKWYVLRQPDSYQCWAARVIQVNGTMATGSAAIAGGPFDSREEAEAHISELANRGTCRSG